MGDTLKVLGVLLLIALVLTSPLFAIWALNTLFHFGIPFTFRTYLAAGILEAAVHAPRSSKS